MAKRRRKPHPEPPHYDFSRYAACPDCGGKTTATATRGNVQYRRCGRCKTISKQVGTLVENKPRCREKST